MKRTATLCLFLEAADLNDANVSSRFIEIKKSLADALQTDIANSGTSHAESLDAKTDGPASRCAKWIYVASLSEVHPRGLTDAELAEYLVAPGQSITGMPDALKKLYDTGWYIEQTQSGRYFFHRHKNLNAQVNSSAQGCTHIDRDAQIETKLSEMFEPRDKRCYQKVAVLPTLDQVPLELDKVTLVVCKPHTDIQKFFAGEKYQNRVAFLTAVDQAGVFNVNKKAEHLWAIIHGVDLEAELRTPNAERGRSALRTLMDNAKRTATDFLVPSAMDRVIKKADGMDAYRFWREFSPEEKFLLKGLELETQGVFKIGAFQDLGRAYGLSDYEALLGPTQANDTRTKLPEELPRLDALRFEEIPAGNRHLWRHSPTRHLYHALKLLRSGADIERAVKHLVDCTDFWNLRTSRLAVILAYLKEMTVYLPHWEPYHDQLVALAIGVENWKA